MLDGKFRRGRAAVLCAAEPSYWFSCRIISANLTEAYAQSRHFNGANFFYLNPRATPVEIWEYARQIFESRPERIVFLEHLPHPATCLRALQSFYGAKPIPPVYIHLYGDFTGFPDQWLALEKILVKPKIAFICASDRHMSLVSGLIKKPSVLAKCPFPVNTTIFRPSRKKREALREVLGVSPEERLVVYTGRISLQKNITLLLEEAARFMKGSDRSIRPPIRLILAGSFDDIGIPFFKVSRHSRSGLYFGNIQKVMADLPREIAERIQFLGHVDHDEELPALYNAADLYVSLSTHHDEDFGMSPAEALCCGCPCVLTNWGGYASLSLDENCALVPVQVGNRRLGIDVDAFQVFLGGLLKDELRFSDREAIASKYSSVLSIDAVAQRIEEIHSGSPGPFVGYERRFKKFAEDAGDGRLFSASSGRRTLYREIYGTYAGES